MSQYMTDYVENLEKLNEAKIQRISELERENAALREDKERLTEENKLVREIIELVFSIPTMSNAELNELIRRCKDITTKK